MLIIITTGLPENFKLSIYQEISFTYLTFLCETENAFEIFFHMIYEAVQNVWLLESLTDHIHFKRIALVKENAA